MNSKSTGVRQIWLVCLLLAGGVAAAYWPPLDCGFVPYDDPDYVLIEAQARCYGKGLPWRDPAQLMKDAHGK